MLFSRLRFHAFVQRLLLGDALFGGVFANVFSDFHLARMRVSCCFGHDEAGAALFIERGMEELNPEVIGVVGARQAEGEAATRPDHVFQPLLVHGVDVERRVGENEVKGAGGFVRVVVITVYLSAVSNVAFQTMHREIHPAEASCFVGLFNAVNGKFRRRIFLMLGNKTRG